MQYMFGTNKYPLQDTKQRFAQRWQAKVEFLQKRLGDYCCFSADIMVAMLVNKNKSISLSRELIINNTFVFCKFKKKVFIVLPTGMVPCHKVENQQSQEPSCQDLV